MSETTQEERELLRQYINPATKLGWAIRHAVNDADRLAAIERQVLWRTEEMPEDAVAWQALPMSPKPDNPNRKYCTWVTRHFRHFAGACPAWVSVEGEWYGEAPDYRPDEPGPLFLPILNPPEGS